MCCTKTSNIPVETQFQWHWLAIIPHLAKQVDVDVVRKLVNYRRDMVIKKVLEAAPLIKATC